MRKHSRSSSIATRIRSVTPILPISSNHALSTFSGLMACNFPWYPAVSNKFRVKKPVLTLFGLRYLFGIGFGLSVVSD